MSVTTTAARDALITYIAAVVPVGVSVRAMQVGAVRTATAHVSVLVISDDTTYLPEPAVDTDGNQDAALRDRVDMAFLVEAFGQLSGSTAADWIAAIRTRWASRVGVAQTLRAAGVYVYDAGSTVNASAFVDTQIEPRWQVIMRAYVPRVTDTTDAITETETVDITLALENDAGDVVVTAEVSEDVPP